MRLAAALCVAVLLAACATTPTPSELTGADHDKTIEGRRGDAMTLRLPSNPSTGFRWSVIEAPNPLVVKVTEEAMESPSVPADVVGAPGEQVWRIEFVGTGGTALRLAYARSWEKGPAAETYDLLFRVY